MGKEPRLIRWLAMKNLMIESSLHKHSSSNLLAEEFIRGDEEALHPKLNLCLGCNVRSVCAKGW